jgi:1-acyl-sn-glycerol-3-phosphate acyltransferase
MRLIQSGLFSLWFNVASFVLVMGGLVVAAVAPQRMVEYARLWGKAVMLGMPLFNCKVVIEGLENLPTTGKALIASQHQSAFDTVLWFKQVPNVRYVVKIELMRIPLFGRLARLSRQIGVDREAGASAMRNLLRDADQAWSEGAQLVIFPEGTRAPAGTVAKLQPGIAALARHSGLPVIPVTTDSGLCWGKGFWGKRPGTIHVRIHPALPAGQRREVLMAQLEALFEAEAAGQRAVIHRVDNSVH